MYKNILYRGRVYLSFGSTSVGGSLIIYYLISPPICDKQYKGMSFVYHKIINCAVRINYLPTIDKLVLGYSPYKTGTALVLTTALKGIHQSWSPPNIPSSMFLWGMTWTDSISLNTHQRNGSARHSTTRHLRSIIGSYFCRLRGRESQTMQTTHTIHSL